jgi:hypothetical protein
VRRPTCAAHFEDRDRPIAFATAGRYFPHDAPPAPYRIRRPARHSAGASGIERQSQPRALDIERSLIRGRHTRPKCTSCMRDSRGRIQRSASAKRDFVKAHPCPATGRTTGACKGYAIDHVVPLKRGGADAPIRPAYARRAGERLPGSACRRLHLLCELRHRIRLLQEAGDSPSLKPARGL